MCSEDLQRRGHGIPAPAIFFDRSGIVIEMADVRRVHEHLGTSIDCGKCVDHRYRMGDRRDVALLPFSDDQLQRVHFRPAGVVVMMVLR